MFKSPQSLTLLASENTVVKLMRMRRTMMMKVLRRVTPEMKPMYHP